MPRLFLVLLLMVVPATFNATAQTLREPATGVEFPIQTSAYGKTFTITGAGVRKRWGFKVYAIASYYEAGQLNKGRDIATQLIMDNASKLVTMQLVRNLEAAKLRDAFAEGLAKTLPNYAANPALKRDVDTLLNAFTDVKTGDKLQLIWIQGGDVYVTFKGAERARFKNALLASGIWQIWLGSNPVSTDLKKSLVANSN